MINEVCNDFWSMCPNKYFETATQTIFLGVGRDIFRMEKIEINRHHDTMKLGLTFKTFGMDLFYIPFQNKTAPRFCL